MKVSALDNESQWKDIIIHLTDLMNSENRSVILLSGNLGVGKTTFIKKYVQSIGGNQDNVDSPTFSVVNTYDIAGALIHHFDLYRLRSVEEIEDIGFMEYIDSNHVCFIEWPEKIAEFLPRDKIINIHIVVSLDGCRKYTFTF